MNIKNFNNIEADGQGVIDFDKTEEVQPSNDLDTAYIEERKKVAEKYNVLHPESIYKDTEGNWLFIKDNVSVEKWDKLLSGNDNAEMYRR